MKTPFLTGILVRSFLLASFSSLVACSSVLQASRLSKSAPKPPADRVADVSPESAQSRNEARQLHAEATYGSPLHKTWGYQWVFIESEGGQKGAGAGYWVVKPNQ